MVKPGAFCLLLLVFLVLPAGTDAFDGDRKGFVLGGCAGMGVAAGPLQDELHTGIYTNLQVGHGFSHRLVLLVSGRQFWSWSDFFLMQALPTASVLFYTSETPGPYLTLGLGASLPRHDRYGPSRAGDSGIAVGGGFGYELTEHWHIELGASLALVQNDPEWGNLWLTVGYLAY